MQYMTMPFLTPTKVRTRMARRGMKYSRHLAEKTGLPYHTLRNAVSGSNPLHLADIYVVAEALRDPLEAVEVVVLDILANNNEGVPDEPPKQPQRDKGPARRQESEKTKTSPKRTTARAS